MELGPGWVKRDDLLNALRQQGLRISNHQLLRWRNAGLLPPPRRVGHGRNRNGSDSYYPWWGVLQAYEVAWRLEEYRRLGKKPRFADVGWALWVQGYPVTDFARRLLIEDLEEKEGLLKEMKRRPKQTAEMFRRILLSHPSYRNVRNLVVDPTVAFQILCDMELGDLETEKYSEWDWQQLKETVLARLFPDEVGDAPDLPSPAEVADGMNQLSKTLNISEVTRKLERVTDRQLRVCCNEAQAILASIAQAVGEQEALMSPDHFLHYFKRRMASPITWEEMVEQVPQLSLPKSPLSPFELLLRRLRILPSRELTGEVRLA